ncbi:nucleotide-binding protein [Candidatus Thorarchaeota archaeon]|nr:MAG: nucleotide-binding protein [Candidatus Thorarchaeota archaeon]
MLDTNFLTVPARFGVDIFSEAERILDRRLEFVVLRSVVQELERKQAMASRTEVKQFRVALSLVDRCRVEETEPDDDQSVDDQLLEHTKSIGGVLATNDRDLRDRAVSLGVPVLILRSKKRLEFVGTLF